MTAAEAVFDPPSTTVGLGRVLKRAGAQALAIRNSGELMIETKRNFADLVTHADKFVEFMITAHIVARYPGHGICGEEGVNVASQSGYTWYIDPIDGTTNFAHGMDLFGISAGLWKDGNGVLGAMYFPALGKYARAIAGVGAWVNDASVRLGGKERKLNQSLIAAGLAEGSKHLYAPLRARTHNVLVGGSFTGEVLWLLEGKIDAYLHTGATQFDLAAASIIVEAAGGTVIGIDEDRIDITKKNISIILARTPGLAHEIRDFFKQ